MMANTGKRGFTLTEILIAVAIVGILIAIAIPNFLKGAETAKKKACINNLMIIDAAKEQYALDYNLASGTSLTTPTTAIKDAIDSSYIKGGAPTCPSDGNYTYGNIGTDPTCDLGGSKGHSL